MPYNALIVPTFGGCRKVELDFNNYEEMGNAIYASLIKIIITPITMRISQELGFTVVGFYNAYCEEECDEENELIVQDNNEMLEQTNESENTDTQTVGNSVTYHGISGPIGIAQVIRLTLL